MRYLTYVLSEVKSESKILYGAVLFNVVLAIICLLGLVVDDRTLMGVNVWIKPLKFAISTAIYVLTVGFMTTIYPYSKRKRNIFNVTVAVTLVLEMGIIFAQAARGIQSHYNQSTLLDGMLFAAMGILIGINVLIMALFAVDGMRLKLKCPPAIQVAIVVGWLVVLFGSWVGGQMISQTAHNVGIQDGGDGIPLLNWSTIGGDLRVAHFFGLHAIQIIPGFAFVLHKLTDLTDKKSIIAVLIFSMLFSAWVFYTFYQAKQGIALIS